MKKAYFGVGEGTEDSARDLRHPPYDGGWTTCTPHRTHVEYGYETSSEYAEPEDI